MDVLYFIGTHLHIRDNAPMSTLNLKIEFGGGLELLFSNQRSYRITLPSLVPNDNSTVPNDNLMDLASHETKDLDVDYLIHYMRDHMLKERVELFMEKDTVCVCDEIFQCDYGVLIASFSFARRPGILVLINDTDWELEGEGEYKLKDGDEVVFISTLHGG